MSFTSDSSKYNVNLFFEKSIIAILVFPEGNIDRIIFQVSYGDKVGVSLTRHIHVPVAEYHSIIADSDDSCILRAYNDDKISWSVTFYATGLITYTAENVCRVAPSKPGEIQNSRESNKSVVPDMVLEKEFYHKCIVIEDIVQRWERSEVSLAEISAIYQLPLEITKNIIKVYDCHVKPYVVDLKLAYRIIEKYVAFTISDDIDAAIENGANAEEIADIGNVSQDVAKWWIWFVNARKKILIQSCAMVALQDFDKD